MGPESDRRSTPIWSTRRSASSRRRSSTSTRSSCGPNTPAPSDYDQPLHRDYGSHSLVVPRLEAALSAADDLIFLSDVTEEDGPTHIVPYEDGKDVPYTPLYLPSGTLADREVGCVGPAGSLLVYRTDILHRGSDMTGEGRSRFSLLADFQVRGTTWGGKMAWPKQHPERWSKFIPACTERQRDLFGFPRPGDPYWSDDTLEGVRRAIRASTSRPIAPRWPPGRELPGPPRWRGRAWLRWDDQVTERSPSRSAFVVQRIYDPPGTADAPRVLVDRLWPRGMRKADAHIDEWAKDVAPSTALRRWYGRRAGALRRIRSRYREELRVDPPTPGWSGCAHWGARVRLSCSRRRVTWSILARASSGTCCGRAAAERPLSVRLPTR